MYLKSSLPICILKLKPEIETENWAALHTGPAAIRGHSLRWQFRGAPCVFGLLKSEIRN